MGIFKCSHSWGFPLRWPEFDGNRNVDVQTCSKCGARRESPVQFGKLRPAPEHQDDAQEPTLAEVRA